MTHQSLQLQRGEYAGQYAGIERQISGQIVHVQVLAVQPEGEGVVFADVDPARLADVRTRLPALAHRRL